MSDWRGVLWGRGQGAGEEYISTRYTQYHITNVAEEHSKAGGGGGGGGVHFDRVYPVSEWG